MRRPRLVAVLSVVGALSFSPLASVPSGAEEAVAGSHGLAMHGEPKYGPDFAHFDYADPDAPKGGDVRLHAIGTFDSLNPFILKGVPAAGTRRLYDTLTVPSADEAFSQYGLIAESVTMPADRSWVEYKLRPEARFHDGSPIEVDDVIFTLELLKSDGHPFYRAYYQDVASAERTGPRTVRFNFSGGDNRELPLIVGQMPVLPKAYWAERDFARTTLEPPLASGPYAIEAFETGRSITWRRVPDYWAAELPVNAGQHNFDRIRYDYYRDSTVALEAFKAGEYDFRQENQAKSWATAYETPAAAAGLIKMELIGHEIPTGMQAFVYNTRRPQFRDRRVRWALAHAFDFEWANQNLFYGAYTRTESYFSNSELAARGLPEGKELDILERFRDRLPEEVFTRPYRPPETDGSGNIRRNLRTAVALLEEAGWRIEQGRLVEVATGTPMRFEILLQDPAFERIALPFTRNLKRLGVEASVRVVDSAQYQNRLDEFDFDMTVTVWGQSLSPGNEQRDFWSSAAAGTPGSRNLAGIQDPVVDELIDRIIAAPDREALVARTRALDRVLLWSHYVIPHWHIRAFRVAYWDKFSRPAVSPRYALGFDTWWVDPDKAAALEAHRSRLE